MVVALENVYKQETAAVVADALRKQGYVTMSCLINSASMGLPQSRSRLYMVGVNMHKASLATSPSSWAEKMQAAATASFVSDFLCHVSHVP